MDERSHPAGLQPDLRPRSETAFHAAPVVWALDAFPDDVDLHLRTAEVIRDLYPHSLIYPVYVLSETAFTDRGFNGFLRPALKPMAMKSIEKLLLETGLEALQKPRVLLEKAISRQICAEKLIRFSKRMGASAIALGTHSRRGLSRFFQGGFSEAVFQGCELPLLITGPEARVPLKSAGPRVVVFPTDFSNECMSSFDEISRLARDHEAELHLFHRTVHHIDPFVQSGVHMLGGGWVSIETYLGTTPDDHQAEGAMWVDRAKALGVKAEFISENFREPTSEAIVEYVRRLDHASPVIAMVSHTGPVANWLLGSVTRDVIRMSPCAVYIASR